MKGTKTVVPAKPQERIVELAHQCHQGMIKTAFDPRKGVVPGDRCTG